MEMRRPACCFKQEKIGMDTFLLMISSYRLIMGLIFSKGRSKVGPLSYGCSIMHLVIRNELRMLYLQDTCSRIPERLGGPREQQSEYI